MQLSTDAMGLICEDPTVALLMSLTCRGHEVRIVDYSGMGKVLTKYSDITTIERLNVGDLFHRAIKFKRLDLLQLSHPRRDRLIENALQGGFDITQTWVIEGKYPRDAGACRKVARSGNLTMLKWCREKGYEWDESTCVRAAASGNLELLQYCRDNGCPWDGYAYGGAAENGHLHIIQWLFDNGCPWSEGFCYDAAAYGHLDILEWVRANGYEWNIRDCLGAARENQHFHIVKWIESQ
jgi:hypothetical protein